MDRTDRVLVLAALAGCSGVIWLMRTSDYNQAAPALSETDPPSLSPVPNSPQAGAAVSSRSPEASGSPGWGPAKAIDSLDPWPPPTGGDASGVSLSDAATLPYAADDFDATFARLLDMAPAIRRAMEATQEELQALDDDFWAAWPQYAHTRSTGLLKGLGVVVAPEAELERMWQQPDTQAIWNVHQWIAWQRARDYHRLEAAEPDRRREVEDRIALHNLRLDELRRALWSGAGEVFVFLWEVEKALREP